MAPGSSQVNDGLICFIGGTAVNYNAAWLLELLPNLTPVAGMDEALGMLSGSQSRRLSLITPRFDLDLAAALSNQTEAPRDIFEAWSERLRLLLAGIRQHRRKIVILFEDVLASFPQACVSYLAPDFSGEAAEPSLASPSDNLMLALAQEMLRQAPATQAMVEELVLSAFLPEQADAVTMVNPVTGHADLIALRETSTLVANLSVENERFRDQHKELCFEIDLFKEQLQSIQNEKIELNAAAVQERARSASREIDTKAIMEKLGAERDRYIKELRAAHLQIGSLKDQQVTSAHLLQEMRRELEETLPAIRAERDVYMQDLQATRQQVDLLMQQRDLAVHESQEQASQSNSALADIAAERDRFLQLLQDAQRQIDALTQHQALVGSALSDREQAMEAELANLGSEYYRYVQYLQAAQMHIDALS